jgi:hypothetical protein
LEAIVAELILLYDSNAALRNLRRDKEPTQENEADLADHPRTHSRRTPSHPWNPRQSVAFFFLSTAGPWFRWGGRQVLLHFKPKQIEKSFSLI